MGRKGHRRLAAVAAAVGALLLAGGASAAYAVGSGTGDHGPGDGNRPPDIAAIKASDANAVLSPLAFRVLNPPWPVVASDGQRHYAYEMEIINQSAGTATLQSVQTVDAQRGAAVAAPLAGAALADQLRVNGLDPHPPVISPGGSAMLFLDVVQRVSARVPASLVHRISIGFTSTTGATQTIKFTGVQTSVIRRAPVVVSPPLAGGRWIDGQGCCSDPISVHRGATLAIDGTVRVAQRFAIDFVRLTPSGQAVSGDPSKLTSYPAFGAQVHAAASGKVVIVHTGEQEQVPGSLPAHISVGSADGNYVVVDIGNGLYAFYAHMQPGSIRVKEGDRVRTGDVLGLLGNTGNTDAPHLHFHIMDGPSPLQSNGVPFVFDSFTGTGAVTDQDTLNPAKPGVVVPVDPRIRAGQHSDELPLQPDVLAFGR